MHSQSESSLSATSTINNYTWVEVALGQLAGVGGFFY